MSPLEDLLSTPAQMTTLNFEFTLTFIPCDIGELAS